MAEVNDRVWHGQASAVVDHEPAEFDREGGQFLPALGPYGGRVAADECQSNDDERRL
jgi:hypothetical protein